MAEILDIIQACLVVIGGLKVIARYTPWKWDDQVLEVLEFPGSFIKGLLKK